MTDLRALESKTRGIGHEPASAFYARLARDHGTDIDLEALIQEGRKSHNSPKPRFRLDSARRHG